MRNVVCACIARCLEKMSWTMLDLCVEYCASCLWGRGTTHTNATKLYLIYLARPLSLPISDSAYQQYLHTPIPSIQFMLV